MLKESENRGEEAYPMVTEISCTTARRVLKAEEEGEELPLLLLLNKTLTLRKKWMLSVYKKDSSGLFLQGWFLSWALVGLIFGLVVFHFVYRPIKVNLFSRRNKNRKRAFPYSFMTENNLLFLELEKINWL